MLKDILRMSVNFVAGYVHFLSLNKNGLKFSMRGLWRVTGLGVYTD